jgi:ABC-type antimicrobial peptide transport system permease subunit
LGAILGAALAFGVSYLVGFVQLELQPLRDPGGQLENLNVWALLHTLLMMGALAILTAFI